ncbi:unnamed protein product [Cochlearia groenlandica]
MVSVILFFFFFFFLSSNYSSSSSNFLQEDSGTELSIVQMYKASLVLVVDLNGGGNFTTVQSAVDAVPELSSSTTLIIINPGIYREKVLVNKNKMNLVLQGGGYQRTSIEWSDTAELAGGTEKSYTFGVYGSNFIANGISFKYNAPEPQPGVNGSMAVAMSVSGDKAAFYRCGFYGFQDTLLDGGLGRHYFRNCFIQGSVDFIYGNGRSIYQDCTIKSVAKASVGGITGFITAQGKDSRSERSGFSFVNCTVDGTGKILLGRAWRVYASVVFSRTYMAGIIAPKGWNDWDNATRDKTVMFGEHRCSGPGAYYRGRVSYSHQMTDAMARRFTNLSYIDGAEWLNPALDDV